MNYERLDERIHEERKRLNPTQVPFAEALTVSILLDSPFSITSPFQNYFKDNNKPICFSQISKDEIFTIPLMIYKSILLVTYIQLTCICTFIICHSQRIIIPSLL